LTRRLEATERRSAKVDARGIWPIGFGIVLTGIPDELARISVIGWLFVAGVVAWTIFAAIEAITDRTAHAGRLPCTLPATAATSIR
jgi:hypothetical protein